MSTTLPESLKEEGLSLFRSGAYDEALVKFETAVTTYAANKNETGQAEMLNNIGVIHRLQGDYTAATAALSQAETIFARLGDRNRQAQTLGNLGDLHNANRDRKEAAHCYSEAASLFARTNDPLKQSQVLRALSLMRLRQGRWLEAMMRMEESLQARPGIGLLQRLFLGLLRFTLKLMGG